MIWLLLMCMDPIVNRTHSFQSGGSLAVDATNISSSRSFISSVLQSLRQSGFYWRGLNKERAESLLTELTIGTFLLRDSSHPKYLFTLSVKTLNGAITHIRIAMSNGRFNLESITDDSTKVQSFENVLELITYYMQLSKETMKMIKEKRPNHQLYLEKPFYTRVCSLQHICRRTIHRNLTKGGICELPIPDLAKVYVSNHPFPV